MFNREERIDYESWDRKVSRAAKKMAFAFADSELPLWAYKEVLQEAENTILRASRLRRDDIDMFNSLERD